MSAPLSKELREKYNVRVPPRRRAAHPRAWAFGAEGVGILRPGPSLSRPALWTPCLGRRASKMQLWARSDARPAPSRPAGPAGPRRPHPQGR